MSVPDIIANLSRGWNRRPTNTTLGTERTGISAALWEHVSDDCQEVAAEVDDSVHHVALVLSTLVAHVEHDGQTTIKQRTVRPGDVTIVPAGVRPRAIHTGPWKILHCYVPCQLVERIAEGESSLRGRRDVRLIDPRCSPDPVIERIGRSILTEMREGLPLTRLAVDASGLALAVRLLRAHSDVAKLWAPAQRLALKTDWRVQRVIEYLQSRLADDVSLLELAALVDLSPVHLTAVFRRATGMPPHRWLQRRRIERACELLGGIRRVSITAVALECGFASAQHFATVFKAHMRVTPSEFRRQRLG